MRGINIYCVFCQIYLNGNETRFNKQATVNQTTDFVYLHHLVKNMQYRLQMTAVNRKGEGVLSDIIYLGQFKCYLGQFMWCLAWLISAIFV
jgi:hypothetical protein